MDTRLSSDTVFHWLIARDVYLLTVKSMPRTLKRKKSPAEIEADRLLAIEDFNTFALNCYDGQSPPQPFFKLNWVQVEQNYSCRLGFDEVLTRYRNKK